MIKYFVIDLDGTLLDSNKQIDLLTRSVLLNVKKAGIKIILSSGRHFYEIIPYIGILDLSPSDYIISNDGQYIYQTSGKRIFKNDFLLQDDIKHILSLTRAKKISFFTEKKNFSVCSSRVDWISNEVRRIVLQNPSQVFLTVEQFNEKCIDEIEKAALCEPCDPKAINELNSYYTVHQLKDGRIEFLNRKVSKFSALVVLECMGEISLDNVLCFGDDMNDIECFNNIKYCVAMNEAPAQLKNKSFFITKSNDESGVAFAIKKLLNGVYL